MWIPCVCHFLSQADIGRHIAELVAEVVGEVRAFQQQRSAASVADVGMVTSLDQQLVTLRAETGQGSCLLFSLQLQAPHWLA